MKKQLDVAKIAKVLGAERRGKVKVAGGYFGALGLLADVEARFRTERRFVALSPTTLRRLAALAAKVRRRGGAQLTPMQIAAVLIERTAEQLSEEANQLLGALRPGK